MIPRQGMLAGDKEASKHAERERVLTDASLPTPSSHETAGMACHGNPWNSSFGRPFMWAGFWVAALDLEAPGNGPTMYRNCMTRSVARKVQTWVAPNLRKKDGSRLPQTTKHIQKLVQIRMGGYPHFVALLR